MKRNEMDRPTNNTLRYVTRVRPHKIVREPFLVDPFVENVLQDFLGIDVVEEFGAYTRSYYTLEGHYYNLWKYDTKIQRKPQDPLLDIAIQKARQDFRLDNPVKSIKWDNLASVPFIPTSSAGWNYVGKKGYPGNLEIAIKRAVYNLRAWSEDNANQTHYFKYPPDLAWTRTQLGTVEDPKIRNVWGKSFDNIILEGMTASPLINAYRAKGYPMPLGINYFKKLPSIINQTLFDGVNYYYGVGLDLRSFDASVQPYFINIAFDILKENIIFSDPEGEESFEYSRYFFIHTPVVMPDGRLWYKHTGVPSGSFFTQLIDSIVNLIANYYAQLCHYGQVFKTHILGDDSLFGVPVEFGLPKVEYFIPHFKRLNFEVHPIKSKIASRSKDLEFLGHCARGTRVDRETAGMLRLALYPEHPVAGPAHSVNRIKGLLLDSALNSWPLIHLHNLMMTKYREQLTDDLDYFVSSERDWLVAILGISEPPSHINTVKTFMLT